MQIRTDDVVDRLRSFRGMTRHLRHGNFVGAEAERPRRVVSWLKLTLAEIDRAAIDSARRTGFESRQFKAGFGETAAHAFGGSIADAPADGFRLACVHNRFQEGARGENHGAGESSRYRRE